MVLNKLLVLPPKQRHLLTLEIVLQARLVAAVLYLQVTRTRIPSYEPEPAPAPAKLDPQPAE